MDLDANVGFSAYKVTYLCKGPERAWRTFSEVGLARCGVVKRYIRVTLHTWLHVHGAMTVNSLKIDFWWC